MKIIISLVMVVFICFSLVSCITDPIKTGSNNKETISLPWYPTVSFETNGGTPISDKKTNLLVDPPRTSRENYLFDGWYRDIGLTTPAIFPYSLEADTVLYAKWLKTNATRRCEDASIKMWASNDFSASYDITPSGFDLNRLSSLGYGMKITVAYTVHYKKDYDVPLDIGYAGSPKYELSILNAKLSGFVEDNLSTSKSEKQKSYSYTLRMEQFKDTSFTLTFSTDNIQNIIYFEDIIVTYTCVKIS